MSDKTNDTLRTSMRQIVDMAPSAPEMPVVQERRIADHPMLPLAAGFAGVILAVGVVATVTVRPFSTPSAEPAAQTAVPTAVAESVVNLPRIGIESAVWNVLWAEESVVGIEEAETSYGVNYAVEKSLLRYLHADIGTTTAKVWVTGLTEGTIDETGGLGLSRGDASVIDVRGREARILDDGDDYVITWRENPNTIVQVTVNTPGMEDAEADALVEAVAASLIDIVPLKWNSYLALPQNYDRYSSATTSLP